MKKYFEFKNESIFDDSEYLKKFLDITEDIRKLFSDKYSKKDFGSLRISDNGYGFKDFEKDDITINFSIKIPYETDNAKRRITNGNLNVYENRIKADEKVLNMVKQIALDLNAYNVFYEYDNDTPFFILFFKYGVLENTDLIGDIFRHKQSLNKVNKYKL